MAILLATAAAAFTAARKEVQIDTNASSINWVGQKVTGQHDGAVKIKSGKLLMEGDEITGGSFVIDMTSIDVQDLEGGMRDKLMGHLKSKDFFNVEEYPTANFNITSVSKSDNSDATHFISGDLTIKGITNKITFPAVVSTVGTKVNAKANFELDRTKWDIKYRSGSFFDGLGDKLIYDDFIIDLIISTK